jgi:hypothetical protein
MIYTKEKQGCLLRCRAPERPGSMDMLVAIGVSGGDGSQPANVVGPSSATYVLVRSPIERMGSTLIVSTAGSSPSNRELVILSSWRGNLSTGRFDG